MTSKHWIGPAAVFTVSWFVIDHTLPELLKIPYNTAVALALAAGLAALLAGAVRAWSWLNARVARPWFPRPVWRVIGWLETRPSVNIITAVPTVGFGDATVDICRFSLTIGRNFARAHAASKLSFENARLVLIQRKRGQLRRFIFSPWDTDGVLSLSIGPGTSDAVVVVFDGVAFPTSIAEGPDFSRDYRLELRGLEVRQAGRKPLKARLPVAHWSWFHEFNSGVYAGGLTSQAAPYRDFYATSGRAQID